MIHTLYSALMWLAQPFLRRKLARRGATEPGYLQAVDERFGRYKVPSGEGYVWIHAVSLGETRAAAILVDKLRERIPGMRLLLTHGTATGRAEGEKLLRRESGDVQVWQPWDATGPVRRFLSHFKPRVGILMETEVWPNLSAECAARGIPLALANARMSEKSLAAARGLSALSWPAYRALAAVWAQTQADAERLALLGGQVKGVFGNLKFDAQVDAEQLARGRAWNLRWRGGGGAPVAMFASSREGEEKMLLDALLAQRDRASISVLVPAPPPVSLQWLVVPRHPQRFDEVVGLVEGAGFSVSRRSSWVDGPVDADVWIGDSLGEMALYYGLADSALLGGSFGDTGGQNLIEAAACGCPVVMGASTFNFAEAAELAEAAGAAVRVGSMDEAVDVVGSLLEDAARQAAAVAACAAFASAHRGAAERTADAVAGLLGVSG